MFAQRKGTGKALIDIQNLTKVFADGSARVVALEDVSLRVENGEVFGIIGMSGAGKSTLLRCLSVLEKPTRGRVLLDGEDLAALSGEALRRARRKMGVVFQGYNLLMQKTVAENVAFPLKLEKGYDRQAVAARVQELLSLVGLADKAGAYPAQLSGGEQQMLAIGRALMSSPPARWTPLPPRPCWRFCRISTASWASPFLSSRTSLPWCRPFAAAWP